MLPPAGAAMRRRPRCGWDERTLVVQSGEPDDDHPPFEQRFNLSDDGQRLMEIVVFKGGRSSGFTRLASGIARRQRRGGAAHKSSQ